MKKAWGKRRSDKVIGERGMVLCDSARLASEVGLRVRARRRVLGISQGGLAFYAGYASGTTVSNLERGFDHLPLPALYRIAWILECPIEALLPKAECVCTDKEK